MSYLFAKLAVHNVEKYEASASQRAFLRWFQTYSAAADRSDNFFSH
jgi:hypothetical protein